MSQTKGNWAGGQFRDLNSSPMTLPAWCYFDAEFFGLEQEAIHLAAWHIVCHECEVPEPGDYRTFELLGERAFVLRDKAGRIRAFHNVCRHRAHALVAGRKGRCPGAIRCPYHGWTYSLEGQLKTVPDAGGFAPFDKADFGLAPVEHEIFLGFIFIRFRSDGPSVAARLAPYRDELAHYRFEQLRPCSGPWLQDMAVDWKNVWDNYLENYHFPLGHPGLSELMGRAYQMEAHDDLRVARLSHRLRDRAAGRWSVRHYQRLLPPFSHLPGDLGRRWSYFYLFPAVAFDVYPDKMDYFQVVPLGPGRVSLRGRNYALDDDRRAVRVSRYLNLRLNIAVQDEDDRLTRSVQKGLTSGSYNCGLLGDQERLVKAFQDWIRAAVSAARPGASEGLGERDVVRKSHG